MGIIMKWGVRDFTKCSHCNTPWRAILAAFGKVLFAKAFSFPLAFLLEPTIHGFRKSTVMEPMQTNLYPFGGNNQCYEVYNPSF